MVEASVTCPLCEHHHKVLIPVGKISTKGKSASFTCEHCGAFVTFIYYLMVQLQSARPGTKGAN